MRSHRRRGSRGSSPTSSGARPSSTIVRTATAESGHCEMHSPQPDRAVVGLDADQRHAAQAVAVVGLRILQGIGPHVARSRSRVRTSVGGVGRPGARALHQPHGDELRRRRPPASRSSSSRAAARPICAGSCDSAVSGGSMNSNAGTSSETSTDRSRGHAQPGRPHGAQDAEHRAVGAGQDRGRRRVARPAAARRPRGRTPSSTGPPRRGSRGRARHRRRAAPRPRHGPGGWPAARPRARRAGGRGPRRYAATVRMPPS